PICRVGTRRLSRPRIVRRRTRSTKSKRRRPRASRLAASRPARTHCRVLGGGSRHLPLLAGLAACLWLGLLRSAGRGDLPRLLLDGGRGGLRAALAPPLGGAVAPPPPSARAP